MSASGLRPLRTEIGVFALTSGTSTREEPAVEARDPTAIPALHRRHTRRPRLTRLLDASAAQAILLTGPPGYGKTSLACEWLADRPVAWYRATPASADLAAFSADVANAVSVLVPGAGDRLRQRLRVAEAPEKAARPLAELLAEDLATWPSEAWLAIDDYQMVVDSAPVEEFVDWLLMFAPIHLLVTSRRRPTWASARRVLYGEVTELGRDQLAMTNDEAGRVLEGRSTETVHALVAQAQGWPAIVGLAALSSTSDVPSERVSDELFRYFAEEVFRNEPAAVQRFMLVASVPQSLTNAVARNVLGEEDPEAYLELLVDEGLLQQAGSSELAFHPLLRDFLRKKLEHDLPDLAESLYQRVSADARASERWDEAFELAVHRGSLNEASEIIAQASPSLLAAGRAETLEKWLDICGPAALQHPPTLLVQAEVLLRAGHFAEASLVAQDAAERLDGDSHPTSRAWYLAGLAAHLVSDDELAIRRYTAAINSAKSDRELSNALFGAFVATMDLEKDPTQYLERLVSLTPSDDEVKLQVASAQIVTAARRGPTQAGLLAAVTALPLDKREGDPLVRTNFLAQLASLHILRARYALGYEVSLRAEALSTDYRLTFAATLCRSLRAIAEVGERRMREARLTLDMLAGELAPTEDPYLHFVYTLVAARLGFAEGRPADILRPLPASIEGSPPAGVVAEAHAMAALAAAATGQSDLADLHSTQARSLTSEVGTMHLCRFATLISAIVGRTGRAADHDARKLVEAVDELGILDVLVLAYRAYPPLIGLLGSDVRTRAVLERALALSNDRELASQFGVSLPSTLGRWPASLTKRQSEVLALLCRGLTNEAIGRELFISTATVKVHLHQVFEKLGVKNRLQAILAAQELLSESQEREGRDRD